MDCSDAKPELERYASDRLTPSERTQVEEHLAMCEECSLEVELIRNRGAAPSAGESDWTVEKIFGAEDAAAAPRGEPAEAVEGMMQGPYAGSGESDGDVAAVESPSGSSAQLGSGARPNEMPDAHVLSAEPPPPAPTVPPALERPSMILPLPQADPDEAPAAAAQGGPKRPARDRRGKAEAKPAEESWDFEPAGAKVGQTPPEETVQLAETALGRRNDRSTAKSAATRALLWGIGGLAGIVLLGASIWLAITVHRAPEPATVSRPYGAGVKSRAADPGPREIATADSVPAPTPAPEATAGDTRPMAASNGAPVSPLPVDPKPADGATNSGAPRTPAPQAAAPRTAAPKAAATSRDAGHAKAPAKSPAVAPRDASTARASAPSGAPKPAAGAAAPAVPTGDVPKKPARPIDDDHEMWPIDDPPPAAGANTDRTPPVAATAKPAPSDPAEGRAATTEKAPNAPPPSTGPTDLPSQPAKPATPLDRLHEATANAAGEGDLIALRKLREAWKNYLRTSVGPERSRAKREFADCLWAIQLLSGRADDQRAALVAYRDFLLSAPAGGTDARSAARLRQLEEVTAERR